MATNLWKMARTQLEKHIQSTAANTSNVFFTAHARRDSMAKRKVSDAEVYECLRGGRIFLEPEEDMKTGHLICRMECYGASRHLAVVVALDASDPNLIVVTVITRKAQ